MKKNERPRPTWANWIWLGLLTIGTAASQVVLSSNHDIPIHWNLEEVPDMWAPARLAVVYPFALGVGLFAFLVLFQRFGSERGAAAARRPVQALWSTLMAFFLVFQMALLGIAMGVELPLPVPKLLIVAAGVLLIVVSNVLPKSQPSWQAGLPVSWTGNDPEIWRYSQRWLARGQVLGGLALIGMAFTDIVGLLLIAAVLTTALLPTLVAFLMVRRRLRRQA